MLALPGEDEEEEPRRDANGVTEGEAVVSGDAVEESVDKDETRGDM
jgi:hypothetical protein